MRFPTRPRTAALIPFNSDKSESLLSGKTSQQSETQSPQGMTYQNDTQAIEKVCRRLTMKWEPIWKITHRYLYCRCILRRSTLSQLCPEITVLINARCPRLHSRGVPHADYGDIDYHQDRYFDQFGGYNAFRGMIFGAFPSIYLNVLGRYAFNNMNELDTVMKDLVSAID